MVEAILAGFSLPLHAVEVVDHDARGDRGVERFRAAAHGQSQMVGRRGADRSADALSLAADDQNRPAARAMRVKILSAEFGSRHGVTFALHGFQRFGQILRRHHRHAEHTAHRRPKRLRAI